MTRTLLRSLPLAALAVVLLTPSEAHARRRGLLFFLITTGETVKHLGDIPQEHKQLTQMMTNADVQVGYMHNRFGLFFVDLWTWDGQYVLYKDDTVWEIDRDQAAALLNQSRSDVSPPFLYRFPPLLLILIAGGVLWAAVAIAKNRGGGSEAEQPEPDVP